MSIPTSFSEFAFSGSLCRIREFETVDGLRYCLSIFSLNDYKHLHFPHSEYKWFISKLNALISTQSKLPLTSESGVQNSDVSTLNISQLPFDGDFKIKFGKYCLTIGPVTSFGLVKTSPFADVNVFSENKIHFACDSKWDICTCKSCPVFNRLIEYESTALLKISHHKP